MKRLYLAIAILAAAFAVTTGLPTTVLADDGHHGGYYGNHGKHHHYKHGGKHGHEYAHRRHHKHHRKHHKHHRKHHKHHNHHKHSGYGAVAGLLYALGGYGRHGGKGSYDYGGYNAKGSYGYDKACHPVSKKGYAHGRPAKIGGTMCYDHYGQGYVVPGSRYVIHYY